MITPERIAEMWQEARKYGSANCWTGTSGKLAAMIVELLKEREEREREARESHEDRA